MKKSLISCLVLLTVFLAGCTAYTGIAAKNDKVFLTLTDGTIEVCDISGNGMLTNCSIK